jgi:hypothetical protein
VLQLLETENFGGTSTQAPTVRPVQGSKARIVNEKLNDISHIEEDDPGDADFDTFRNA